MRFIKEKIRFTGQNKSIKISISDNNNLNGLQESIDNFIEEETGLSINSVDDGERLRYLPTGSTTYVFNFYDGVSSYSDDLLNAGFTSDDINNRSEAILKSFYIVQIYDGVDTDIQTLLHTGYYNGFLWVVENGSTSTYADLDEDVEFTNYYISNDFIEIITGSTETLYARFYFYNAKTGKLQVFFNEANELLTTEEKLYFELTLNPMTKTYEYSSSTLTMKESDNSEYINKINESLSSFNIEKPTYPEGQYFTDDGDYEDIP